MTAFATVTLGADEVVLLDAEQFEGRGVTAIYEHEFATRIEESLTLRESRAKDRLAMRTAVSLSLALGRADAADLRAALAALAAKIVAVPLWVDRLAAGDWATQSVYAPQYLLRLDTRAIVGAAAVAALDPAVEVVPVVFGRLKRPELRPLDLYQARVKLEVVERGPYERRVEVRDLAENPSAFPAGIEPNWVHELVDRSTDNLEELELGRGREPLVRGTQGLQKWGQGGTVSLERGEMHRLLSFWQARAGRWGAFTAPVWFRPHPSATPETPDGIVARFASDILRVDWHGGTAAEAKLDLWQLPWETNPVVGETPQRPSEAFLYDLTTLVPVYAGGPVVERVTDWEHAITIGGATYTPRPIEHDRLTESDNFTPAEVELVAAQWEGSTLLTIARGEAEAPTVLRLSACDPADPAATVEILLEERLGEVRASDRELQVAIGGQETPELPRIVVSREGTTFPEELWQIRTGLVEAKSATQCWISWLDDDQWGNPEAGRFVGWYLVREADQTRRTITAHATDDGDPSDVVFNFSTWAELLVGDRVHIRSPYVRRAVIDDIWDDVIGPYAKKYIVTWTDGSARPAQATLDGGTLESGQGDEWEARAIAYQFDHGATQSALLTRRPLRHAVIGAALWTFPGWDGTWSQLQSRFPLARDHVVLFPYTPGQVPGTDDNASPFQGDVVAKK